MGNKISKKEKARREAEAKQQQAKKDRRFYMALCLGMLVVMWLVGYWFNGMELRGLPNQKQVTAVEIGDLRVSQQSKTFTEQEDIKNACKVAQLLRVKYGEAEQPEEAVVTMKFQMEDGSQQLLEIGETTLQWNGHSYEIKQRTYSMFLDVVDGLFFFPEAATASQKQDESA